MKTKNSFNVLRQKHEVLYSLGVILVIATAFIVLFALFWVNSKRTLSSRLNSQAKEYVKTISTVLDNSNYNQIETQELLAQIEQNNPEITEITLSNKLDNKYVVFASSNFALITKDYTEQSLSSKFSGGAGQPKTLEENNTITASYPNLNYRGDINSIMTVKTLTTTAYQDLNNKLARLAFFVLFALTIVILMLINHFKFVSYSLLNKKINELDILKDNLLLVAVNQLKAPIKSLSNHLNHLVSTKTSLDQSSKKIIEDSQKDIEKANNVLADFTEIAELEEGKIKMLEQHVIINDLIENIAIKHRSKADKKDIKLITEQPSNLYVIMADKKYLTEVISRLVDNAIKYTESGSINLSCAVDGNGVAILIKDTGKGISEPEQTMIFKQFYRTDSHVKHGTGLGLMLCKSYVEKMGGSLKLNSKVGRGSTFIVEFNLLQKKQPTPDKTRV